MRIFLWGDLRNYHSFLLNDLEYAFEKLNVEYRTWRGTDFNGIIKAIETFNPDWLYILGGKLFPLDLLDQVPCKKYARWLFGQSLPKILLKHLDMASAVNPGHVGGRAFFSTHYTPIKYFNNEVEYDPKYASDVGFIGWAGKDRGRGIYERTKRNICLASKKVTHWNEVWGHDIYDYNEVAKYHKAAKIGLNVTHRHNEINMRIFEYAGVGTMILSDINDAMNNFFEEGKEYVGFEKGNVKQMEDLIDYYLTHDAERERIAKSAQVKVMAQHTTIQRLQETFARFNSYKER